MESAPPKSSGSLGPPSFVHFSLYFSDLRQKEPYLARNSLPRPLPNSELGKTGDAADWLDEVASLRTQFGYPDYN